MRSVVQGRKVILKGDTTTTAGVVLTGSDAANEDGREVARKGDDVFCPVCNTTSKIVEGTTLSMIKGIEVALEGHRVDCLCPGGCSLVSIG